MFIAATGVLRLVPVCLSCLLAGSLNLQANEPVTQAVHEAGFTGYVQQQSIGYGDIHPWDGVRMKRLSEDRKSGRLAVYAEFPPGYANEELQVSSQSIDLVMLDGQIEFGEDTLGKFDFAFLPPASNPPRMASITGAHALVFFDPPSEDLSAVRRQQERGSYVTRYDPEMWQTAMLAKKAGATADLKIMHLKQDPDTTARSWFVKLDGAMTVPWEVHSMAEEGYVMEGGYVLAECLPDRTVIGEYDQGGYFYRPGGIPHSGPDSGPKGNVIWLQRSPVSLDVVFYNQCEEGKVTQPVAR